MAKFHFFRDRAKCPVTRKTFVVMRRNTSAGRVVGTYCRFCREMHRIKAGRTKEGGCGRG